MNGKSKYMVLIMTAIVLLLNRTVVAQDLNRQMFSSQGKSIVLKSGTFISQSIGQQSTSGSFSNSAFTVQQGFQHSAVFKFNKPFSFEGIETLVYPNPVGDNVNFKFSSEVEGGIKMSILSAAGRLVFRTERYAVGNIMSVESLGHLPAGVYVVYLSALNYKYTTKIIKN